MRNAGRALAELWGQGREGLHLGRMKVGSTPDPCRARRGGVMEEATGASAVPCKAGLPGPLPLVGAPSLQAGHRGSSVGSSEHLKTGRW